MLEEKKKEPVSGDKTEEGELTKEQMLGKIFHEEMGRSTLEILQVRARSKKELAALLEDLMVQTQTLKSDYDELLDLFVRTEIVQVEWIEYDLYLFLLADFCVFRRPAHKVVVSAEEDLPAPDVAQKFLESVSTFFAQYTPTFEDNLVIAKHLANAEVIKILMLLREKSHPLTTLPRGPKQDLSVLKNILSALEKDGIVMITKDKQNEDWVLLRTDITAQIFYPEYLIENIRKDVAEKKLDDKLAIKHLELLETNYDTFFGVY